MSLPFTDGQKKRYFEKDSCECPQCCSTNIVTVGNPVCDGRECRLQMKCLICKKKWNDIFRRYDIESLSSVDELSNFKQFIGVNPEEEQHE